MNEKPSLYKTYFADGHRMLLNEEQISINNGLKKLWILEEQAQIDGSKSLQVWRTPNGYYLEVIIDGKTRSLTLIEIPEVNGVFRRDNI